MLVCESASENVIRTSVCSMSSWPSCTLSAPSPNVKNVVPSGLNVFGNESFWTVSEPGQPDFAELAKVCGLWGKLVDQADHLEGGIAEWLAAPGPALLHIKVEPMELVMPPHTELEPAIGMALYAAKAILQGRGGDLVEMAQENV